MREAEPFLAGLSKTYNIDVLSDMDDREVHWHQNNTAPWGNSYYCENTKFFSKDNFVVRKAKTLDTIVSERGFPAPDFMKIDVQGSEIDILMGASKTLKNVEHLIIELQHTNYNEGAPQAAHSVPVIESLGFKCVAPMFSNNGPDADYDFKKV